MQLKVPLQEGFEGGHGSHWDAVIEDPGELARLVSATYKRGEVAHELSYALPRGMAHIRILALPLGNPSFEVRVVEVDYDGDKKPGVETVYPHLKEAAAPLEMRPRRIIEWGHGAFEAQVGAQVVLDDAEVTFFATDYYERRALYRSGEPMAVALSAIAYTSGVISPKERIEKVGASEVDVSQASIVAPLKDSERAPYYDDDFFLQGPVVSCAPFAYPPWGEGAVLRLDLGGLGSVPVFARKKDFPHGWPRAGEFVAAYSWLQGRQTVEKR